MCTRHQDKITTATVAGPCCIFRWDGPDSHQYLFITEPEREAKAQEKGENERDKAWPETGRPPGKPYGKPHLLEGQGIRQKSNL